MKMSKIVVFEEAHTSTLRDAISVADEEMRKEINNLYSIYGKNFVDGSLKDHLIKAVQDPNYRIVELPLMSDSIRNIADLLNERSEQNVYKQRIVEAQKNVIENLKPDVFYIEGRSGHVEPHIEKYTRNKTIVHLDDGCNYYDMLLGMLDKGNIEDNLSYGWAQRQREMYWVDVIEKNPPKKDENSIIIVGANHLEPNNKGFGKFKELLNNVSWIKGKRPDMPYK